MITSLPPRDCRTTSRSRTPSIVFVGYGVVAPEYGWDDYKGVDVKGKTMLMLINDPPIPDPSDPTKLDPKMFGGRAMTYYGRWTYKYEIAAEKGAAAAIIIHETEPAAYPYSVVHSSWSKENFEIDRPNKNMDQVGGAFLDHAGYREETARRQRPGFRQTKSRGLEQRFPASLVRRDG